MSRFRPFAPFLLAAGLLLLPMVTRAHGVDDADRAFLEQTAGTQIPMFIWLGAKHMVTGYDHLLFLLGVIFFLHRLRDVAIYVTLFALGHSVTLTSGVLTGTNVNAHLIDAIIGLSVVYKGLDNLGFFQRVLGFQPDTRAAVLIFGLFHGLGLATKLQEFSLSGDGLVPNILSFNVGVELGQFAALAVILVGMRAWRSTKGFARHASGANVLLVLAGIALTVYQLHGYFTTPASVPAPAEVAAPSGAPPAGVAPAVVVSPEEGAFDMTAGIDAPEEFIFRNEAVELTLEPNKGAEVKAVMRAGDQMLWSWKANGDVHFEFHGERKGAAADEFSSYEKGSAAADDGEFEAPFEGTHGWYWKNRSSTPITIRVEARGVYAKMSKI